MQTFLPAPLPSIQRHARSVAYSVALALFALVWLSPLARAQVTVYTDEGTFNAATANLRFIEDTFENIAPAGGDEDYTTSSLYSNGPITYDDYSADVGYVPQQLDIQDPGYIPDLSLNGSAYLLAVASGVDYPTVSMMLNAFQGNAPGLAFGVELGFQNPYGGENAPSAGEGVYGTYPLTDTIDIQLYLYDQPVGEVYHLPSTTDTFIGFVSTQPFDMVSFTQVNNTTQPLYGPDGGQLNDPYEMAFDNVRFSQNPTLPTVTVVGSDPNAEVNPLQQGAFVVTLSTAAATDLQVAYTVKGSATPGTDYKKLPDVVTIPAGATSAKIKVKPKGNLGGGGSKVVKLTLQAGTGYIIGTPDPVKVKIKQ